MRGCKLSVAWLRNVGVALVCMTLVSCVPNKKVQFTAYDEATLENSLREGMSPDEVRAVAGAPPETLSMEYGSNTDQPWDAYVMVYWGEQDPDFEENEHPLKHRLVFAIATGDTLLDHWILSGSPSSP